MFNGKEFLRFFQGRIHPEGWLFIRWSLLGTFLMFFVSNALVWLGVFLTLGLGYFFRDPFRVTSRLPNIIVSPADGIIMDIEEDVIPPLEMDLENLWNQMKWRRGEAGREQTVFQEDQESDSNVFKNLKQKKDQEFQEVQSSSYGFSPSKWRRVSIFLNVLDVHVNRYPMTGVISRRFYKEGQFLPAMKAEAGFHNEQTMVTISSDHCVMGCVQIAGILARRIVCNAHIQDEVRVGERYGIICFGSRMECYIPEQCLLLVEKGQRVIGGETLLALIP